MFVARAQHRVARCYITPCPPPFATPILLSPPHLSLHSRSAAWCPSLSLRSDSVLWQYIFQTLPQPSANSSSSSRPQLLIEFINWVVQSCLPLPSSLLVFSLPPPPLLRFTTLLLAHLQELWNSARKRLYALFSLKSLFYFRR